MDNIKQTSASMTATVSAMSANHKERTEQEKEFDQIVASCIIKKCHKAPEEKGRLFSVTTIAASQRFGGTRCVAICDSFERAVEMVTSNEGDIFECSYRLVVIEQLLPNYLYGGLVMAEPFWFLWNLKAHQYEPIETPEAYESSFGFGIG